VGIRVREIQAGEAEELARFVSLAFAEDPTPERVEDELGWAETDRLLAADVGGEIVGCAGAYTFRMAVPGGATIPVAGVTWVAVQPTHRRRGVLTALMGRQLDDVAARGEPVAVLTASEAPIYGRFGYGLATRLAKVRLDTAGGLPLRPEPAPGGRIRIVDAATAEPHARRLLDAVQPSRPGELSRPDRWWPVFQRDRPWDRHGATARQWVLHESDAGEVDGFAHYRVKARWGPDDAVARNEVRAGEVVAPDPEVEAALLAFLCEIDLSTSVTSWSRPVDDPFRLRLVDERRYRTQLVYDHLYARVLDVPAALAARRYGAPGTAVVGIADPFRPSGAGCYRLEVGDDGAATVERVGDLHDGAADAFLTVDALGCLYLGDTRAWQLAAAGRLAPASEASLRRVDRIFATPSAPYCTMRF
jgi:predicted acetyltransferase